MVGWSQLRHVPVAAAALIAAGAVVLTAQPTVVPGFEGQIGKTPGQPSLDRVHPPDFAPVTIPGSPLLEGNVVLARIFQQGGLLPDPPAVIVVEDRLHSAIFPALQRDSVASAFAVPDKVAPAVEPWLSEDDFVAMSFALDGSVAGTMKVQLATYDIGGAVKLFTVELDDIPTIAGSEAFAGTDVAVDQQSRATTVFTEVPSGGNPRVKAQTWDALTGDLGDLFEVSPDGLDPEVAMIKPDGEVLVVPSLDITTPDAGKIQGNFVDLSGATPDVAPEIAINTTTSAFGGDRPAVAADLVTGRFTVSWDLITGMSGDPSDIRARRYDEDGLPVGDDFLVNVKPIIGDDGAQGQSDVAYGPGGLSVVVWAADGATGDPDTDVYARAFLPNGSPIIDPSLPLLAGQFRVNTGDPPGGPLSDRQDRPRVRFLPEPDSAGRPQFAVVWRDVGDGSGADPNGTGTSYRCFAIDGLEEMLIFADGFESGDTSSWSSSTP